MDQVRVSLPLLQPSPDTFQHRDAKHRFDCRECGREFKTEDGRDKVGDGSWARLFLLMPFQHFDAMHRFKCRECDAKFDSQYRMDEVIHFLLPVFQYLSHTYSSTTMPNTGPIALFVPVGSLVRTH